MEAFLTYRKSLALPDTVAGEPVDMDQGTFSKFLGFLATNQVQHCILRGNETTLHPQFADFVKMAVKKKITPLIETTGIMLEEARQFIIDNKLPITWRLYSPECYDEDQKRAMLESATAFHDASLPIGLIANITNPEEESYDWMIDFLQQFSCRGAVLRFRPTNDLGDGKNFAAWFEKRLLDFLSNGVKVILDCALPPCAFTDEAYGRLARCGILPDSCRPRSGIRPDGRLYHCREMFDFPGAPLASFKRMDQLQKYYFKRNNSLQWDYRFYPDCQSCPSLLFAGCQGPCMGIKARRQTAEAERLAKLVAETGDPEDVFNLGGIYLELCRFAEAEECLLEARLHMADNGQLHLFLGRTFIGLRKLAEAEEEFRKAARLSGRASGILEELSKHLADCGKHVRSRLVLEEARKARAAEMEEAASQSER